jgi:hypothetical protein
MYDVTVDALANNDACEIAKQSWNMANRFKTLFTTLVLVLGVLVLAMLVYAGISFRDDQSARGYLALISGLATGAGALFLLKLRNWAANNEDKMYQRVIKACGQQVANSK